MAGFITKATGKNAHVYTALTNTVKGASGRFVLVTEADVAVWAMYVEEYSKSGGKEVGKQERGCAFIQYIESTGLASEPAPGYRTIMSASLAAYLQYARVTGRSTHAILFAEPPGPDDVFIFPGLKKDRRCHD